MDDLIAEDVAAPTPESSWHAIDADDTLKRLASTRTGLTPEEVSARLQKFGRNELPAARSRSWLMRFALQFHNVLIYALLAAAAVTLALGHFLDAAVIAGVVVINAVIGVIQEGKAERALQAVHAMLALHAIVVRGGERHEIDAAEVVPGDIVLLAAGDRVPADVRLLRVKSLRVDESPLTGESVPVDKHVEPVAADAALAERRSMAYSGTTVTFGQATGIVVGTATQSEIGRIGSLVSSVPTLATPLTRKLDQFARRITVLIIGASALVFLFGYFVHDFAADEIFLAVVGLAVAAIPEGLPVIVTVALAIGTQRMATRHAIVRRLPAVETLGSVTVICTDKTGTLTRNEMTAVNVLLPQRTIDVSGGGYAPEGGFSVAGSVIDPVEADDLLELARCGLLCNDASVRQQHGEWQMTGDPTEGALVTLALKSGLVPEDELAALPRIDEIPFDSRQCFMATLHHDHAGHARIYLKGAPETVLRLADTAGDQPMNRGEWEQRIELAGKRGARLLALAVRNAPRGASELTLDDIEAGFKLLGMAAMIDPPRAEAVAAIAECQSAGIRVKMITGDHGVTASAIGAQLGLSQGPALAGAQIEELDDDALTERLRSAAVIARASPSHKLRIVRSLQADGQQVAMTGDGVNDAPALRAADIGVAMGRKGTDAARESADLVLTDDNFATIGNAVREGRTIFDNIKKSLIFILPTNGGEAGVILLAVFMGLVLPVTAVQILWINMVTTVTLAIALAFEPTERDVMVRPPRDPSEPLITRRLLLRIVYVSVLITAATFVVFQFEIGRGSSLETARTAAVNAIVMAELVYLFNTRFFVASAFRSEILWGNRPALGVAAALIGLQLLLTYTPWMQQLFSTGPLDAASWLLIAAMAATVFIAVELEKAWLRYRGLQQL